MPKCVLWWEQGALWQFNCQRTWAQTLICSNNNIIWTHKRWTHKYILIWKQYTHNYLMMSMLCSDHSIFAFAYQSSEVSLQVYLHDAISLLINCPSLLPYLSNSPSFNLAHMAINRQQHKHMQKQHKHMTDIDRVRIEKYRFYPSLCNLYCNLPSFNLAHIATNKKQHKHMQKQHTHTWHTYTNQTLAKQAFIQAFAALLCNWYIKDLVHVAWNTQILLICTHICTNI